MNDLFVPKSVEDEYDERQGNFKRSPHVMRLRPTNQQQQPVDNHLLLVSFPFEQMAMFRGAIDPRTRYWWLPISMHFARVTSAQGNEMTEQVLCNKGVNAYYANKYGSPVIFERAQCPSCGRPGKFLHCNNLLDNGAVCGALIGKRLRDDRCPSCEQATLYWDQYNLAWSKTLGVPVADVKKVKSALKRSDENRFKELAKSGTGIDAAYQNATSWSVKERFVMAGFDLDKLSKRRALESYEDPNPNMQLLFTGEKIWKVLAGYHRNGKFFYQLDLGIMIVIQRDTSRSLMQSEYTTMDGTMQAFGECWNQQWYEFYQRCMPPDVTNEIKVLDYDEHVQLTGLNLTTTVSLAQPPSQPQPQPQVTPMGMGGGAAPTPFTPAVAPAAFTPGAAPASTTAAPQPFTPAAAPASSPFTPAAAPAPTPFVPGPAAAPAPQPFTPAAAPASSPFTPAAAPAPAPFTPSPVAPGQIPAPGVPAFPAGGAPGGPGPVPAVAFPTPAAAPAQPPSVIPDAPVGAPAAPGEPTRRPWTPPTPGAPPGKQG